MKKQKESDATMHKMRYQDGKAGYIYVYSPTHPRAKPNGYVAEHIIVAERKYGRQINPKIEDIHHINKIKSDNRPENIIVLSKKSHQHIHNPRYGDYRNKRYDLCICGKKKRIVSKLCRQCNWEHTKILFGFEKDNSNICSCGKIKDKRSKKCIVCYCRGKDKSQIKRKFKRIDEI
jgi:hypothetical protein